MEYFRLNNGIDCPVIGIGTFMLTPAEAENSVREALKMGYRMVDTANAYVNERAVEDGKLKSIGLSNYYEPDDFDRVVNATTVRLALLQNETHPYHQSGEMKDHIAQYGTVLESWFPLGGRG